MPESPLPHSSMSWLDTLSEDARNLVLFLLSHRALEPALRSPWIVDVRLGDGGHPQGPLLPGSIILDIGEGELGEAHRKLARLEGGQQCILLREVLQRLPDYRSFVAAAFDRLAAGGFLVLIVPHQFLYERKLQVPSRYDRGHLRFYTPGTLLAEIEEALDPCRYRVRLLADYDAHFDYGAGLGGVPGGGHDIVLCLEKIAPPPWRAAMEQEEIQSAVYTRPGRFLAPYENDEKSYRVVAPDHGEIGRLIVLKLDHRGDFLMALPAFHILRESFPNAEITLVCGSWNRQEAEGLGLFARVVPFDFFPEDASAGSSSRPHDELRDRFAELIGREHYDVAIDLRLYEDTRELVRVVDARHKAGFDPYDAFRWLTIPLNPLVPTRVGRAEIRIIPSMEFHTRTGRYEHFAIIFPAAARPTGSDNLLWGPYAGLQQGQYDVEVLIESLGEAFELRYDLACNDGRNVLGGGVLQVARDRFPRMSLRLTEPIDGFEFRLLPAPSSEPLPAFRFMGLRLKRYGAYVGVHQREAMALLAHLVALRLHDAYTVTQA